MNPMEPLFWLFAAKKRLPKRNTPKKHRKRGLCLYKALFFIKFGTLAGVAQLVERDLPKVDVEGSRPFSRSKKTKKTPLGVFLFFGAGEKGGENPRRGFGINLFSIITVCFFAKTF